MGGEPENPSASRVFSFNFSLPDRESNQYYTIDVKLEDVTEYEGSCANYIPSDENGEVVDDAVGKDLKLKADRVAQTNAP